MVCGSEREARASQWLFVNWGFVGGRNFNIVYLFSGETLNLPRRGSVSLEREVKTRFLDILVCQKLVVFLVESK